MKYAVLLAASLGIFAQNQPAKIVFYRDSSVASRAPIRIDGEKHRLRNNRYLTVEIPAGDHFIYCGPKEFGKTFTLESGHTYYFRVQLRYPTGLQAFLGPRFLAIPIPAELATAEMTGLKPE